MFTRILISISLLIAASSNLLAAEPVALNSYLSLRKKLLTKLPYETIKADASSYIGKVFEVRGRVAGFSKNDEKGGCLILSTDKQGSFLINTESLPSDSTGTDLACLVRVGEGCKHSLSDLRLVACTYDVDFKRYEESKRKTEEAKIVKAETQRAKSASGKAQETKKEDAKQKLLTSEQLVEVYKKAIKGFNKKLSDSQADTIAKSVLGFSYKYKVDPRLVCAVILAESHFKITATSPCGAQGLGQLMPSTAAGLGVDNAYDPVDNIYGSVRYIRGMLDRMAGSKMWNELTWNDLALALAAYNAGPGAVKKHGGVPPYKETQNYVRRVVSIYKQLCGVK